MIPLLVYGVGAFLGFVIPLGSTRWAALLIVSTVLDDFRFHDVSVPNVFLIAFLTSLGMEILLGGRLRNVPSFVSFGALVLTAVVSAALSADPLSHIRFVVSLGVLAAAAVGLAITASDLGRLQILMSAVLWMSGVVAFTVISESALWVFFGIHFKDTVYYLINLERYVLQGSGFFSSNALAAFHIVPGLSIAAILRSRLPRGRQRARLSWYLILAISAMIATFARAALVSMVMLGILLLFRRSMRAGWMRLLVIALLIAIVTMTPFFLRFISGFNINSIVARYAVLLGAARSITQHPIVGSGPGSRVVAVYPSWAFEVAPHLQPDDLSERDTHNTLLQIPVDLGIVGLICCLWISAFLLWTGILILAHLPEDHFRVALEALLVALVVTEFFSLFDSMLYTKPIWLLLGLCTAAIGIVQRRQFSRGPRLQSIVPAVRAELPCDA